MNKNKNKTTNLHIRKDILIKSIILVLALSFFCVFSTYAMDNNMVNSIDSIYTTNSIDSNQIIDSQLSNNQLLNSQSNNENLAVNNIQIQASNVEEINNNENNNEINSTNPQVNEQKIEIEEKIQTQIEMQYVYNEDDNTVTAEIVSNVELRDTKPMWKLSSDRKKYTHEFSSNQTYTTSVVDINGDIYYVTVEITQIQPTQIEMQYVYNSEDNTVTAKIVSNVELRNTKPTWTLSADRKTYSHTFSDNRNYTTTVVDGNGEAFTVNVVITQIQPTQIEMQYVYNSEDNTVTAKIVSNVEFRDTKPTWTLSEDRKTYSHTFSDNRNYTTTVVDRNGEVFNANVVITQIQPTQIEMQYVYNSENNTVTAKIVSNVEFRDTKPTWTLSADRKTYSHTFSINQTYQTTAVDRNGEVFTVTVAITQVQPATIEIHYEYDEDTNIVTAKIVSNMELKDTKPMWKLSSDKKTYTNTFNANQTYTTPVVDITGQTHIVNVEITQIVVTHVDVSYDYDTDNKIMTVTLTSNVKLKNTKPTWTLSDDQYSYSKEFTSNFIYTTTVVDKFDNVIPVQIVITRFKEYLTGIDVARHQGTIDWEKVKNDGIDFAIIRCGYGENDPDQDDMQFARNISECERLGIPYGIYLYSYALTENGAYSEAAHALRLAQGHDVPLGVWIDMEDADGYKERKGMPSNQTLVNICKIFCDELIKNNYKAGIYANLNWWNNILNDTKLDAYDRWVAQWYSTCTYTKSYIMWQYTDSGHVEGIVGNVDMDRLYMA